MNSRNKGNKNEREAAELISAWTKKKFARTPSSGGLNWKSQHAKGDIVCTTEGHYHPFCWEIKAHKEIRFEELIMTGKKGVKILEFWAQCKRDADICHKTAALMMRYDRMPRDMFFLVLPFDYFDYLCKKLPKTMKKKAFLAIRMLKDELIVMDSREFFKIPYRRIKKLTKLYLNNGKEKKA